MIPRSNAPKVSLAPGQACEINVQCDGGLCVDAINLPDCVDAQCCASYCDLLAPDCPLGTECVLVDVDDPDSSVGAYRLPD